jgi:hypothetical protein
MEHEQQIAKIRPVLESMLILCKGKQITYDFSKDGTNEWDNLVQAFVTKRKSFE